MSNNDSKYFETIIPCILLLYSARINGEWKKRLGKKVPG